MSYIGNGKVRIGWSAKELLWLKAAMTLKGYEAICALDNIASMSGRTISAVRSKMKELQFVADPVPAKRVPLPAVEIYTQPAQTPPSPLKQPTRAQMMAGR